MPPVRSIHVGVANRAESHLKGILDCPGWRPVGLVDINRDALLRAAALSGVVADRTFTDVDEALSRGSADAAVVVTPSRFHYPHVLACLEAGLHVLVEKPFTTTLEQAVTLVALAKCRGLTITVCQQYRFQPREIAVAEVIKSGVIGPPQYAELVHHRYRPTVREFTMPHAMLVEMSIHHFDDLRALLGANCHSILATEFDPSWSNYRGGAVSAMLRFTNGAVVTYLGTFTSHSDDDRLRIECELGVVGWDAEGVYLQRPGERRRALDLRTDAVNADQVVLERFAESITTGRPTEISGAANLGTLAMVEAAIRSVETGGWAQCAVFGSVDHGS